MATSSNFYNKRSVNSVKAANGNAEFKVGPGQKEGIFAFACGSSEGLVSQKAMAHLRNGGSIDNCTVADVDYINNDGQPASCTMLIVATSGLKSVEFTF